MIQKKSLKDAIQNPEIISVVGGLLPLVNGPTKGLSRFKINTVFQQNKTYKIKYIDPTLIYSPINFDFYCLRDGQSSYLAVILNGYKSSKSYAVKVVGANDFVRIYKKLVNEVFEYLVITGNNGRAIVEITCDTDCIEFSETNESVEGWEEVIIQNIV